MQYKGLVEQIKGLNWKALSANDLQSLMILSAWTALEFAESVRLALSSTRGALLGAFRELASGELDTSNLTFAAYNLRGDHADFLWHFVTTHRLLLGCGTTIVQAGTVYTGKVRQLPARVRVMSVVSRERELPDIFRAILGASGWDSHPTLEAYRYYLQRHIELDSGEGGHADLLADYPVDDSVLPFYEARLEMYRAIPALFT